MFRTLLCAIALLMAAPTVADQAKVKIHPLVWADFQAYLEKVGGTRRGAYAVRDDGRGGGGAFCPQQRCTIGLYNAEAIANCEQGNPGHKCIIFAEDRDIQIDYEVGE